MSPDQLTTTAARFDDTVACGAIDPGTSQDCANVRRRDMTRCAGPHRFRSPCREGCILDWPHEGEACLV